MIPRPARAGVKVGAQQRKIAFGGERQRLRPNPGYRRWRGVIRRCDADALRIALRG